MTPLPPALKSSWQMAALSREVGTKPLPRTVAGVSIVLFRTSVGVSALIDRCPHRNYPLSEGRLVEGSLQCPYHGWRFGPDGACVEVPGCTLSEGQDQRLAAAPVVVKEINGAVLIRLDGDAAAPLPDLTVWGAPDHDHFWWSQGVWRGRALDALENVLDPFHTNFIHDGIIRRSRRRVPVSLSVETGEDWIESVIEQPQPDLGWMSRLLEPPRERSRTRLHGPTTVQARWEGPHGLTLCVTVFFTPVTETTLAPFACFTTPKGRGPGWLKQAAIRAFLIPVVAQDRRALSRQLDNIERFGAPRFLQGPGDLLGARVARLFDGERLEPGREGPFEHQL